MEGLSHTRNDVLGTGDEEGMLDEGHCGTDDVGLLKGIRPDSTTSDLAGDGQHRHRVHVRVGDGGDEVGSTGAGCRHADSGPARDHGVALGGVAGTLLMAHQNVPDPRRGEQWVVEGQNGTARHPEDVSDTKLFQRAHQSLGACHDLLVLTCGSVIAGHRSLSFSVLTVRRPAG